MQSTKPVESVLDDIIKKEFQNQPMVESVSVVSKSGLIITGEPSKLPSKPEMFSAMVSVIFTSVESCRSDNKKDKLDYVIGVYKTKKIFVQELSSSLMVAVTTESAANDADILKRIQNVITKTKEELIWLR